MLSKEWLQGCKMMADAGVMFQSDAVKSLLDHIAELEENAAAQALAKDEHIKKMQGQIDALMLLVDNANAALARAKAMQQAETERADANQAKIDALMFEHCPDEMTEEQKYKWAISQAASKLTNIDIESLRAGEDLPCGK